MLGEWLCTQCKLKHNSITLSPKSPTVKTLLTESSNPNGKHTRKLSLSTKRRQSQDVNSPRKLTRANSSLSSDVEREKRESVSSSHEELSEMENAIDDEEYARRNQKRRKESTGQSDKRHEKKSRKPGKGSTTPDNKEPTMIGETSDKIEEADDAGYFFPLILFKSFFTRILLRKKESLLVFYCMLHRTIAHVARHNY